MLPSEFAQDLLLGGGNLGLREVKGGNRLEEDPKEARLKSL